MSYPKAVLTSWLLALLLALLLAYDMAHAEPGLYLDMGVGMTQYIPTVEDGTWYQEPLPHRWLLQAPAFKVGLGYQFKNNWFVQANYMDLGKVKVRASVVDDPLYDPKAHSCKPPCSPVGYIKVHDHYYGPELLVGRAFPQGDWSPYLKGGLALLFHRVQMDSPTDAQLLNFTGAIPMLAMGGGLQYRWAYAEGVYYHGPGGTNDCIIQSTCGHPISKQLFTMTVGVRIPLGR
jgi:hypothetical protein